MGARVQGRHCQWCHRLNLPYGDTAAETLDIFFAADGTDAKGPAADAPVLVFLHGGYWRSLDKADFSFIGPAFAAEGACVVIPNYALCPGTPASPVTIPDITLQMVKALAWVYRHIADYGGDARRITVVGHSAGGHLAAMLAACRWKDFASDLPADLLKNALSISGLFELDILRHSPYLQDSLKLTPAQARKASPALMPAPQIRQGRGKLVSVAGGDESPEFLRHNRLIQKAWGRKVVPVSEALPGLNHFSVLNALVEPGHRLNTLALNLLATPSF